MRRGKNGKVGVRSGSLAFARSDQHPASKRFERTGANGREHRWLLPCGRSWVRVPSSALKTPVNRGFRLKYKPARRFGAGGPWLSRGPVRCGLERLHLEHAVERLVDEL